MGNKKWGLHRSDADMRSAIEDMMSGANLTINKLSQESGVCRQSLTAFMFKQGSLHLRTKAKICKFIEINKHLLGFRSSTQS